MATIVQQIGGVKVPFGRGTYTPALVASGGGVVAAPTAWKWRRVGQAIECFGAFTFTPNAAGVAEVVTFDLPFPPSVAFAVAGDLDGAGTANDPDTASTPQATPAALTGQLSVLAAAATRVSVAVTYNID